VANLFKVIGLMFGPMTVLSSVQPSPSRRRFYL
jgi:hypothetical protein